MECGGVAALSRRLMTGKFLGSPRTLGGLLQDGSRAANAVDKIRSRQVVTVIGRKIRRNQQCCNSNGTPYFFSSSGSWKRFTVSFTRRTPCLSCCM